MKQFLSVLLILTLVLSFAGCAASGAPADAPKQTENQADKAPALISREEAKRLAFEHAQVSEADVTDLDVDLEEDAGIIYYDLDFDVGTAEYDYAVDAQTGKILRSKVETPQITTQQPTQTENPSTQQPTETTKPATETQKKKTAAQAKAAAFKHAKVKESQVTDLDVELDKENGKLVYEVSFDAGGYEYDYDIDAYTGKVLRHQKEKDD